MSTEKDQNQEIKIFTKIIKFPNVEKYAKTNYTVTRKQMEALNKIYKRVSEDLFNKKEDKDENDKKND